LPVASVKNRTSGAKLRLLRQIPALDAIGDIPAFDRKSVRAIVVGRRGLGVLGCCGRGLVGAVGLGCHRLPALQNRFCG
jgi:hypothetical protein